MGKERKDGLGVEISDRRRDFLSFLVSFLLGFAFITNYFASCYFCMPMSRRKKHGYLRELEFA